MFQTLDSQHGAFTAADRQRKGLFECADGGTVFPDEIGELPLTMQPDLLRVLQQGEFKELENVIEPAIALGVSPYVQPEDLPKAITLESAEVAEVNVWDKELNAAKKSIAERALRKTGGNRKEAACLACIRPTSPWCANN